MYMGWEARTKSKFGFCAGAILFLFTQKTIDMLYKVRNIRLYEGSFIVGGLDGLSWRSDEP